MDPQVAIVRVREPGEPLASWCRRFRQHVFRRDGLVIIFCTATAKQRVQAQENGSSRTYIVIVVEFSVELRVYVKLFRRRELQRGRCGVERA